MKKQTIRNLCLAAAITFTLPVLAQQQTQPGQAQPGQQQQTQPGQAQPGQQQQTQPGQAQPGQQQAGQQTSAQELAPGMNMMDDMTSVQAQLQSLRAMHEQLGMMISALEQQVMTMQGTSDRISALEQQAREQALRQARGALGGLGPIIDTGGDTAAIGQEVARIRTDLRRAFAGATGQDITMSRQWDQDLGVLTDQLLAGREEYRDTYGRAVADLDLRLRQADRIGAVRQANLQLSSLRAQLEAGGDTDAAADDLERIRGDLEDAYRLDDDELDAAFSDIGTDFDTLTQQVREGADEWTQTFDATTQRLRDTYGQLTGLPQGQQDNDND